MGDEISNLRPRVVINQSTAPTGSDNELKNVIWIDSSSGDTAKTYNTSTGSWESIGGKPDGDSIIKNSSGEITVAKPSEQIIGDFSSNKGDWTFEQTEVSRLNGAIEIAVVGQADKPTAIKTVDMSPYETLELTHVKTNGADQQYRYSFEVGYNTYYDNNLYGVAGDDMSTSKNTVEIDVSNINEVIDLYIWVDATSSYLESTDELTVEISDIKLKNSVKTVFNGAGE